MWAVQFRLVEQLNVVQNRPKFGERKVRDMAKIVIKLKPNVKRWVVGFAVASLLGVCGEFPTRPYALSVA